MGHCDRKQGPQIPVRELGVSAEQLGLEKILGAVSTMQEKVDDSDNSMWCPQCLAPLQQGSTAPW